MKFIAGLARSATIVSAVLVAGAAHGQQLKDVSIGVGSPGFGVAAARVAKEIGLYERHGINPKLVVTDTANAAITGLISRSFDVALAASSDLIAARGRGQKIVTIANAYSGNGATLVLSKAAVERAGVSPTASVAERLKILDGMLIGSASPTSISTVSLRGAVSTVNATVRFTYMAPAAMAAALEAGSIQGYVTGAPSWAPPVVKGSALVWISGPKGEFPKEYIPASSGNLQAMRDFAEANPDLMKKLAAVLTDLATAIKERPADVKAAVGKVYPSLDDPTLDVLFTSEFVAWTGKPLTAEDMAHEIRLLKLAGAQIPSIDSIDPRTMILP